MNKVGVLRCQSLPQRIHRVVVTKQGCTTAFLTFPSSLPFPTMLSLALGLALSVFRTLPSVWVATHQNNVTLTSLTLPCPNESVLCFF